MGAAFKRKFFDMPTEQADKFKQLAETRGISQAALFREAIDKLLTEHESSDGKSKRGKR